MAEALVGAARSYVFDVVGALWASLQADDEPSPRQRALYRLSLTPAFTACVQAVDQIYHTAGGPALYAPHPLDRCFRDIHTINRHDIVWPQSYETVGRMLLELEPGAPFF